MNAEWLAARDAGTLVPMEGLRMGTRVLPIEGPEVVLDHRLEALRGLRVCRRPSTGELLVYAGCAEVIVLGQDPRYAACPAGRSK